MTWAATVLVERGSRPPDFEHRLAELKSVTRTILNNYGNGGVLLFPGGWFETGNEPSALFPKLEFEIGKLLLPQENQVAICLGIDGNRSQIGLSLGIGGIMAVGKKFYLAPADQNRIDPAPSYLSSEQNRSRIFTLDSKSFYIACCYDVFGVKHEKRPDPRVDAILDMAHEFCLHGEGPSGAYYFARDGLAGASKAWNCPRTWIRRGTRDSLEP